MQQLIFLLFILFIVVQITLKLMIHPGQIILFYSPWTVVIPLWAFLLGSILLLLLFYWGLTLLLRFRLFLFSLKNSLFVYSIRSAQKKTNRGLIALIEQKWKQAENYFLAGIPRTGESLIHYLGAAKAAHEQGASDRCNDYLQKAYHENRPQEMVIGLVQTQFALSQQQFERAIAILVKLKRKNPYHPQVLFLLQQTYMKLQAWEPLFVLLPSLAKANVFDREEQKEFALIVWVQKLKGMHTVSLAEVRHYFYSLPRYAMSYPAMVSAYIQQLMRFPNTVKECEKLLTKTLQKIGSLELAQLYLALPNRSVQQQLGVVGRCLKNDGEQASILFVLGKLCVRAQLWGKAKDYFNQCLAKQSNPEASLAYGHLLEHLGEVSEAMAIYKEGLTHLIPNPSC